MKKDYFEHKPFRPCVTLQDILAFDPQKPETYTKSPLMNAILEAVSVVGISSTAQIARYLEIAPSKLWGALEILTGMSVLDFRDIILEDKIDKVEHEHPDWSSDMIAHELGYSSRSALFNAIGRESFDKNFSYKCKEIRYIANRRGEKRVEIRKKKY